MDGSTSERVVLICEECGERTVLSGSLSGWLSGSASFGCECGRHFGLADHVGFRKLRLGISKP